MTQLHMPLRLSAGGTYIVLGSSGLPPELMLHTTLSRPLLGKSTSAVRIQLLLTESGRPVGPVEGFGVEVSTRPEAVCMGHVAPSAEARMALLACTTRRVIVHCEVCTATVLGMHPLHCPCQATHPGRPSCQPVYPLQCPPVSSCTPYTYLASHCAP